MASSVLDLLTLPDRRRGPSALGLAAIGVLFVVPGVFAPNGPLRLVGVAWLVAAVGVAVFDLARRSRADSSAEPKGGTVSPGPS